MSAPKGSHFAICNPACASGYFSVLDYVVVTVPTAVSFNSTPSFTLNFGSALSGNVYIAVYDTASPTLGWNIIEQGNISGSSVTFPAQNTPISIPANDTLVFAVLSSSHTLPTTPTPSPTTNPSGSSAPLAGPTYYPTSGSYYGWAATAVANQLQFPVQSGYGGSGQSVAIVIDAPANQTYLAGYLAANGITRTGTVNDVQVDSTQCTTSSCGPDEGALDLQTIAGLAPGANVTVYDIAQLSFSNILNAYNTIISQNAATVVSSSFGGCESSGLVNQGEAVIAQAKAQGIIFVASSGDQGNECFSNGSYIVGTSYPASDPNVIGVGGTETNIFDQTGALTNFQLTSSAVWNDPNENATASASGGGVSSIISIPTYQQGLAGISSSTFRNEPDVSMPAQDTYVYYPNSGSNVSVFLGTSWGAPQFAALMAEVEQYCGGAKSTYPAALPYVAHSQSASAFIDVTSGNNQYQSSTPFFSAGTGYDNVSGLGTPKGMLMAQALCPNHTPVAGFYGMAPQSVMAQHLVQANVPVDIRPNVRDLTDLGRRDALAQTDVQVVVAPGPQIAEREAQIISTLQAHGMTITRTFPNHLIVNARGTTAVVEALFSTQLHDVAQGAYGRRYEPFTTALAPSGIAGNAVGFSMDNVIAFHHPIRHAVRVR